MSQEDPVNAFDAMMADLIRRHGHWVQTYEGYLRDAFNHGIQWALLHSSNGGTTEDNDNHPMCESRG